MVVYVFNSPGINWKRSGSAGNNETDNESDERWEKHLRERPLSDTGFNYESVHFK
ncbi:Hypothetical protein SMAX5B_010569 [Scophthalmus maximus]|uniref:Uncharacterized protein n=1 Tax=Scophthalmus maximus TaxID=52904 RepID=A0A2U9B2V8_SCOMX|nr:Hypothetical protein SMAX5B_010569 [Scophthalmus maximus]